MDDNNIPEELDNLIKDLLSQGKIKYLYKFQTKIQQVQQCLYQEKGT